MLLIILFVTSVTAQTKDEFAFGRKYQLNPTPLTWSEAHMACRDSNGTLATIYSISTIGSLKLEGDWTFWIGLRQDEADKWLWTNGKENDWTNWNFGLKTVDEEVPSCVASVTQYPYWWLPLNCSERLPSLCEIREGSCTYEVVNHATIIAYNNELKEQVSVEECKQWCNAATEYVCRSFEHNPSSQFCQFSDVNEILKSGAFINFHQGWNFYHRTCNQGFIINASSVEPYGVVTPIIDLQPSSSFISSSSFTSSSSSIPSLNVIPSTSILSSGIESSSVWDNILTICTEIDLSSRPPNESYISEEVRELQELQTVYKERRQILKKTSVKDPRPSSTYIGSTAVIIACCILGLIVLMDIVTFPTHFISVQKQFEINNRKRERKDREKRRLKELEKSVQSGVLVRPGNSILTTRNKLLSRPNIVPPSFDGIISEEQETTDNNDVVGCNDLDFTLADDTSSGTCPAELTSGPDLSNILRSDDDVIVRGNWTLRRNQLVSRKSMTFIYDGNGLVSTKL